MYHYFVWNLSPLGTAATVWSSVPAPYNRWWLWSYWWNSNWQGKPKYSEKTCPGATLSTRNPTWPHPGSNLGCRRMERVTYHCLGTCTSLKAQKCSAWKIRSRGPKLFSTMYPRFAKAICCIKIGRRVKIHKWKTKFPSNDLILYRMSFFLNIFKFISTSKKKTPITKSWKCSTILFYSTECEFMRWKGSCRSWHTSTSSLSKTIKPADLSAYALILYFSILLHWSIICRCSSIYNVTILI
jgi:hypothetical protein